MSDIDKDEITPLNVYLNRRNFLKTSIYAASGLGTMGLYRFFRHRQSAGEIKPEQETYQRSGAEKNTALEDITHYNNFYEFSTDKEAVADAAKDWSIKDWSLEIGGLVEKPFRLGLDDLLKIPIEEKIYRLRCVEGWSMVIPWQGFRLSHLLEQARPLTNAKYVAFESYYSESDMPSGKYAGIQLPYVEGLRLDEAMHPLTILATGLYGKTVPNQNGAPIRLVVPWKYGFKSLKSVVKISLVDHEPPTTWNIANPSEYGFYSNVNPEVDHPRWSQKHERRIGELGLRETLMFNGYAKEVESLYADLDLRKNF